MKFLLTFTLLFCLSVLPAQNNAVENDSLKKVQGQKALEKVEKGLTYLSYLNYFDRTVDRMRGGIDDYKKYEGKLIKKVDIRILKPFGTSLDQPDVFHPNKAERMADKIQVSTREWVVRNKLIFKAGDKLVPVSMADSERDIWNMGAFKDVKIVVTPSADDNNAVDITVLVRDRFSWSPFFTVAPDMTNLGFELTNMGGIPHSLLIFAGPIYRADNPYIISALYSYNNIANWHVNAAATFKYERLNKGASANITRGFYSAFSRWAFAVRDSFYKQDAYVPGPYVAAINSKIEYNVEDVWLARSIPFDPDNEKSDLRKWVFALRYVRETFFQRDSLHTADYSLYYPNSWFALAALGVSNWDYYLNKDVYSLGEAEYFTKGFNFALLTGVQHQEDLGTRIYTGLRLNHGIHVNKVGFWFSQFSCGGFLNKTNWQQVTAGFQNNVFSAPERLGNCVVRHFLNTNLIFGFLLPPGEQIVVNDNNGIRGFYYNTIRGDRSFAFSYQLNFYPTAEVLTFTTCVFAFADVAVSGKQSWSDNRFIQAYGVGIRLRSLKLGIDYFTLTFAYYPNLSIPAQRPFNFIAEMANMHPSNRNDLFAPAIVSP